MLGWIFDHLFKLLFFLHGKDGLILAYLLLCLKWEKNTINQEIININFGTILSYITNLPPLMFRYDTLLL